MKNKKMILSDVVLFFYNLSKNILMDLNNLDRTVVEKRYTICPTCQGTGFLGPCEESLLLPINNQLNNLPLIHNDHKEKIKVKSKKSKSHKVEQESHLPSLTESSKGINFQDLTVIMENFLEEPKEIQNPSEILRLALQKLKKDDCEHNISALRNIAFLSKCHPMLVEPVMSITYRKLSGLLQNTRFQIINAAAQIAAQLFGVMRYTQRPEFDELTAMLLQKTAHMNKSVREFTNKALDAMILNIPAWHCVRVLTSARGAGHKNPEVRVTVSRLLEDIVKVIGEKNLLHSPNLKDTRRKIFLTLAQFLGDGSYETRMNTRKLIKFLLTYNEFEDYFYQDIDLKLFRKIEKDFISLKYE